MDIDKHDPGSLSWVSLQSPDPEAAGRFYGTLLGWQFGEPAPGLDGDRSGLMRGRPAAGIGPVREPGRPGWTTYIAVLDADDTAREVAEAGGTVLSPPRDVSSAGRKAVFADPGGARFAVWQPGSHAGTGVVEEPGAFSWAELITDDVDASAAFYGSVFGWTVSGPEGPLRRREWLLGGRAISGLLPRPPAMSPDIPPYWDVYFTVADATVAAATAVGNGATQLMPPTDIGVGHIAVFLDPMGAVFTLMAPRT